MAITELFSTSFLFSISIIVLLIGLVLVYVSYRMGEQDHKLNSMIGLVSTMAEESQFFRNKLNVLQQQISVPTNIEYPSQIMRHDDLIHVSDEEEEDEEDIDEEDIDEEDIDEDSEEDNDDSEEDNDDSDDEQPNHKINFSNEDIELNKDVEELSQNEIKTVHLEEPIEFNIDDINLSNEDINEIDNGNGNDNKDNNDNMLFLKTISLDNLGELADVNKQDYKKMSLNKLREVIINKGLVQDASKLKKNEILKLLE